MKQLTLLLTLMLTTAVAQAMSLEEANKIMQETRLVNCESNRCYYEDTGEYFGEGLDGTITVMSVNRYTPQELKLASELVLKDYEANTAK